MATKNGAAKRFPISDKLATDAVGLQAFEQLKKRYENRPDDIQTKKEKHFAVINLLKSLQVDNRLWHLDGTPVN